VKAFLDLKEPPSSLFEVDETIEASSTCIYCKFLLTAFFNSNITHHLIRLGIVPRNG
jgi:hypothetical protein